MSTRLDSHLIRPLAAVLAVYHRAGRNRRPGHRSPPDQQAIGQPERQAIFANPLRRRLDVVGHPAIGDFARAGIEHRKRGRRIAIARLSYRAENGQPAPAPEQLHRDARCRDEARHFCGRRHRIERGLVDVAAERDVGFCRHDAARGIQRILDIAPSRGIAGFGMNVKPVRRDEVSQAASLRRSNRR